MQRMTTATVLGPFRLKDCYRVAREEAHLDQQAVADYVGVSRPLISKWERGKSAPTVQQHRRIAEVTKAEWLLDLEKLPIACKGKAAA